MSFLSRFAPSGERGYTLKEVLEALTYLTPFFVGLVIFTIYPFLNVFAMSFKEDYNLLTGAYSSLGIQNFADVFNDRNFLNGLVNTGKYMIVVVPLATVLSLLAATLLNNVQRLQGFFQTAYFLPMVTSVIAIGLVWKWMFNFDYGLINYGLSLIGVERINWLNNPAWNLPALIIYGTWSMLPFTIILLLAGLQNINRLYYTAARVDGASTLMVFRRITLPLLAPTIGLTVIINMISASQVFSELFPLFNGKPGAAYSLYTVVYYLFDAFYVQWKLGLAAASAVILFLIVLTLTVIQLLVQRRWGHY